MSCTHRCTNLYFPDLHTISLAITSFTTHLKGQYDLCCNRWLILTTLSLQSRIFLNFRPFVQDSSIILHRYSLRTVISTEWQVPIFGVHSIMMEKSALADEGVGPLGGAPFHSITITYKVAVYSPYFISTPICTLWLKLHWVWDYLVLHRLSFIQFSFYFAANKRTISKLIYGCGTCTRLYTVSCAIP
jgi:hypothetical protein